MADWVRDLLPVRDAQEGGFELVGPFGERRWQPTPAEHCTAEYKAAETRRLCDELGTTLGVGPKP